MAKTEYQRLTRACSNGAFAVAFTTRSSLWLGADHLLLVSSSGYTETYKRFYLRDIQALVVQRTSSATVVNIVFTVLLVLALAPALGAQSPGLKILCFTLAGLFALVLIINLLLGQTCRCFLRTAVQTEPLLSLNRVGRAQKFSARLRPLLITAQGGELTPQLISDLMREQAQPPLAAGSAGDGEPSAPPPVLEP